MRLNIKRSYKTPQNSAVNVKGYQRQQQEEKLNLVPFIIITEQQRFTVTKTCREQNKFYKNPQQYSLLKVPQYFRSPCGMENK